MLTNNRRREHVTTSKNNTRTTNQTEGQSNNSSLTKNITSQNKGQTRTLFALIRKLKPTTLTCNNRLNNNRFNITRSLIRAIKVLPDRGGLNNKANFRQRRNARKGKVARTKNTFRDNSTRTLVTLTTMGLHELTDTVRRNLRSETNNNRRAVLTYYNNGFNRAKTRCRSTVLITRCRAITFRYGDRAVYNQSDRANNNRGLSRHKQTKLRYIGGLCNFVGSTGTKVSFPVILNNNIFGQLKLNRTIIR